MSRLALISIAGAAGTAARYLLSAWLLRTVGPAFPYGTLAVNVVGSFLLGALMHAGLPPRLSSTTRVILGTGFLGGFTTYSAFNYETLRYLQEGAWGFASLYVAATLVLCLAAGALGMFAARTWVG